MRVVQSSPKCPRAAPPPKLPATTGDWCAAAETTGHWLLKRSCPQPPAVGSQHSYRAELYYPLSTRISTRISTQQDVALEGDDQTHVAGGPGGRGPGGSAGEHHSQGTGAGTQVAASVALSGPLPNIAQYPKLNCEAAVYFQAGKFVWGAEGFKWIGDTKGGAAPGAGAGAGQGGQQPQYSVASQASQQQPARSPAT